MRGLRSGTGGDDFRTHDEETDVKEDDKDHKDHENHAGPWILTTVLPLRPGGFPATLLFFLRRGFLVLRRGGGGLGCGSRRGSSGFGGIALIAGKADSAVFARFR